MEKNALQQKVEIVKVEFPIGCKICNIKLGSIGIVSGEPLIETTVSKIFVPVSYGDAVYQDDVECIIKIDALTNRSKEHS